MPLLSCIGARQRARALKRQCNKVQTKKPINGDEVSERLSPTARARYRLRMPRLAPQRNRTKSHGCLELKQIARHEERSFHCPVQRLNFCPATPQSSEASQWRVVYFSPISTGRDVSHRSVKGCRAGIAYRCLRFFPVPSQAS